MAVFLISDVSVRDADAFKIYELVRHSAKPLQRHKGLRGCGLACSISRPSMATTRAENNNLDQQILK